MSLMEFKHKSIYPQNHFLLKLLKCDGAEQNPLEPAGQNVRFVIKYTRNDSLFVYIQI